MTTPENTEEPIFDLAQVTDEELAEYVIAVNEDTDVSQLKIQMAQSGAVNIPDDFYMLVEGLIDEKIKRGF